MNFVPRDRTPLSVGLVLLASVSALLPACGPDAAMPAGQDGWLTGDTHQKLDTVAKHLRGLDVAMIEIDHRYSELYWAGQDQNWEYAAYQLDKIKTALTNALERRPKRSQSAQLFLDAIPFMKQSIDSKSPTQFADGFLSLAGSCNGCHAMEKLGYLQVRTPEIRVTSVRGANVPSQPPVPPSNSP